METFNSQVITGDGSSLQKYQQENVDQDSGIGSFSEGVNQHKSSPANSLQKYQLQTDDVDSGLGSSFVSSSGSFGAQSQKQIVETGLEKVDEELVTANNVTDLEKEFTKLNVETDCNAQSQMVDCIKKAFTPDEDNDTLLNILLAHNKEQEALQLIEICPSSCYLDIQNNNGQAGIHIASYLNKSAVVHKLIMKGARLDTIDIDGKNVFHLCAERGHVRTLAAILDAGQRTNQISRMSELLHERENRGFTPFFLSVSHKNEDICRILSSTNINVHIPDGRNGNSPLHEAIIPGNAHQDFIKFLLEDCKLNVNHQDFSGVTPLHIAASQNDKVITSLLLSFGADVTITDIRGYRAINYTSDEYIINSLQNQ